MPSVRSGLGGQVFSCKNSWWDILKSRTQESFSRGGTPWGTASCLDPCPHLPIKHQWLPHRSLKRLSGCSTAPPLKNTVIDWGKMFTLIKDKRGKPSYFTVCMTSDDDKKRTSSNTNFSNTDENLVMTAKCLPPTWPLPLRCPNTTGFLSLHTHQSHICPGPLTLMGRGRLVCGCAGVAHLVASTRRDFINCNPSGSWCSLGYTKPLWAKSSNCLFLFPSLWCLKICHVIRTRTSLRIQWKWKVTTNYSFKTPPSSLLWYLKNAHRQKVIPTYPNYSDALGIHRHFQINVFKSKFLKHRFISSWHTSHQNYLHQTALGQLKLYLSKVTISELILNKQFNKAIILYSKKMRKGFKVIHSKLTSNNSQRFHFEIKELKGLIKNNFSINTKNKLAFTTAYNTKLYRINGRKAARIQSKHMIL